MKTDGSEDHLIHCFKGGQPCTNGLDMLNEQQNLLSNVEYLDSNPIEITESDLKEANRNNTLIDPSDSEDDLVDIKLLFKNIEKRKLPMLKILFLLNKCPSLINASLKL